MNRSSFAALALLTSFVSLAGSGCSSEDSGGGTAGSNTFPAAGTGTVPTAGTGTVPTAGPSAGGTGTAGAAAMAGSGGAAAGTSAGGSATGGAGASTGGAGAGGVAAGGGGAAGATTGGAGAGAGGSASCPAKIDSSTVCTAVASCPGTTCGLHKLGSRDCSCAAATGNFTCSSCTYKGTEAIVVKPEAALTPCAMADSAMEDTKACTKGDRCKSLDTTKDRVCACWDDPAAVGSTVWDCDSTPSAWK